MIILSNYCITSQNFSITNYLHIIVKCINLHTCATQPLTYSCKPIAFFIS